jgi:hypothetical protein
MDVRKDEGGPAGIQQEGMKPSIKASMVEMDINIVRHAGPAGVEHVRCLGAEAAVPLLQCRVSISLNVAPYWPLWCWDIRSPDIGDQRSR